MYDPITLTVEREFTHIAITEQAASLTEFLELCRRAALALGYHPDNWDEAILDAADDLRQDQPLVEDDDTPIANQCQFCWEPCEVPSAYCSDDCKSKHELEQNNATVRTLTNNPLANEPSA